MKEVASDLVGHSGVCHPANNAVVLRACISHPLHHGQHASSKALPAQEQLPSVTPVKSLPHTQDRQLGAAGGYVTSAHTALAGWSRHGSRRSVWKSK